MFTVPLAFSFLVLDNYWQFFLLFILLFAFMFLQHMLYSYSAILVELFMLTSCSLSHTFTLSLSHSSLPHIF